MREVLGNTSTKGNKNKVDKRLISIAQMLNEAEEIADLIENIKEKLGQKKILIEELEDILCETEHLIEIRKRALTAERSKMPKLKIIKPVLVNN